MLEWFAGSSFSDSSSVWCSLFCDCCPEVYRYSPDWRGQSCISLPPTCAGAVECLFSGSFGTGGCGLYLKELCSLWGTGSALPWLSVCSQLSLCGWVTETREELTPYSLVSLQLRNAMVNRKTGKFSMEVKKTVDKGVHFFSNILAA